MLAPVTVIIATYGSDRDWEPLAERALKSLEAQTVHPTVIRFHGGDNLSEARNVAARSVETEWQIFLDADDELDPQYVEKMLDGSGDIRQPLTVGFDHGVQQGEPNFIPPCDLWKGNYIVVGAMHKSAQFRQVGGFENWPILEDWALWLSLMKIGAKVGISPGAIYRIHFKDVTRNSAQIVDPELVLNRIRKKHFPNHPLTLERLKDLDA